MAKKTENASFVSELLQASLYKRNQGRRARQLTALALALVTFFGTWTLSQGPLGEYGTWIRVGVPLLVFVAAAWVVFRAVNFPRFADFLISVEAEMDKVSWSSRQELQRAAIVVLSVMFFLGLVLFTYDILWRMLFKAVGILQL